MTGKTRGVSFNRTSGTTSPTSRFLIDNATAFRPGENWSTCPVTRTRGEVRAASVGGVDVRPGPDGPRREELEDLRCSVVVLARKLDVDPEGALAATNGQCRARIQDVEAALEARGIAAEDASLALLESLWNAQKP